MVMAHLLEQFGVVPRDMELAAKHQLADLLEARPDPVIVCAVVRGGAGKHVRAEAAVLLGERQARALVVNMSVVRPSDRDAQAARHQVNALHADDAQALSSKQASVQAPS